MKKNPILFYTLLLTLLIELILVVFTYVSVGSERIPAQSIRILFQLILIFLILTKSKKGLFVLVSYHIVVGLIALFLKDTTIQLVLALGIYHLIIGILLYFHDNIEQNILKIKNNG